MTETAEVLERQAAREEAEKAHEFAEKLRKHFSDSEASSCASWMLERAEAEEYESLALLIKLADEPEDWQALPVKGILAGLALGAASWAVIIGAAVAVGKCL